MKLNNIIKTNLSFDIKALYLNRLLQEIGAGFFGLFLPIFLFEQLGYSVQNVILFYIASFGLFGLLVPFGAMMMSKLGLKYSMILGTIFLAIYFLCFYYLKINLLLFLVLSLIVVTLFRILYWVPYHTDFAKFTTHKKRGKQIAILASVAIIVGIITPVFAGFIIEQFGFYILFLAAFFIVILSIIPLFSIRKVCEEYSYSYFQTFKELFKNSTNRKLSLAYGADGAQAVVTMVIWPIFIYQLLNQQYLAVGAISSAIILATVFFNLAIGDITDRMPKKPLIKIGTILFAIGWVIKIFIQTGFQIFIVSTYHSFAGIVMGVPFTAFMYREMDNKGHYIDEYTVLREVSLNIGRVLMLGLCFVLLSFVGLSWTFLLAAIASLFVNVL